MENGKGKKLVYVSEELLQSMVEAARKEGMSVGKFMEEALTEVLKANEMGYSSKQTKDLLAVLQIQRNLGEMVIPKNIFLLIMKSYGTGKGPLLGKWYECGEWHGKYLNETFKDPIAAFRMFLEQMGWDLNEVEIRKEMNGLKLRCISATITADETEILSKFIEGAICSMGYRLEKRDVMTGMIILEFREDESPRPVLTEHGHQEREKAGTRVRPPYKGTRENYQSRPNEEAGEGTEPPAMYPIRAS